MRRCGTASAPSPRGGTEPRARRRSGTVLLASLALLLLATPVGAQAREACGRPDADGLAYSLGLDAVRDATGTDVEIVFELLGTPDEVDVAMLLFADGIQASGPTPVRRLGCGDRARWTTRLPVPEGTPLDLHATPHVAPGVPAEIAASGPDDPYAGDAFGFAYDANDMNSIAFGAPRTPPRGTWTDAAEIRRAPLADAYLYDADPRVPTHVRILDEGEERWSFGVWFAETRRRAGEFALTCTVDDRQIDAFEGRPLWFGRLAAGEAALVEARTPPLAPGWHEVRCLVLDDLFAGAERGVAWPYVIRSAFVHRRADAGDGSPSAAEGR